MADLYGGVEAGGTKFNCIIASGPQDIRAEARIPTTTPAETLTQVIRWFGASGLPIRALGIASFGPLDLRRDSPTYGYITTTPKPGWRNTALVKPLQDALGVPVAFDTDVNGAALGEGVWGAARGLHTFLYLTIGTGIGGGAVVNGQLLHGLTHPEMGHIRLPHDLQADPYPGACPFHGDCFEGLASGPTLWARWQQDPATLPPDHPAWRLEVRYIALALVNYICVLSPQRIILGGGVMDSHFLFPRIRAEVQQLLNGYIAHEALGAGIDRYIVPPELGARAGVLGAVALAMQAAQAS